MNDSNTTTMSIKTKKDVKELAQMRAREIGLPLGSVINVFLREFGRTGELHAKGYDELSDRGRQLLRDMKNDIEGNGISGEFNSIEEFRKHIYDL